jgi:hypothetical protein
MKMSVFRRKTTVAKNGRTKKKKKEMFAIALAAGIRTLGDEIAS